MIERSWVPRMGAIARADFLRDFKKPARPVVLEGLTAAWPARAKWSLDYFESVAGDVRVPVYSSRPSRERKHQHAPAATVTLRDYFGMLRAGENDLRLFFFNLIAAAPALQRDFEFPDIGLKLFKKLPVLFMGGKGARVQMHFDIDLADILLCHFGARKRVLLVSPAQTRYMYRVPFSFSALAEIDFGRPDFDKYPALKRVHAEYAELDHGDVLYIPPGYWHYVTYDDVSFSMALRAFPRIPGNLVKMAYNIAVLRTIEGAMRKLVGQPWNDRNERRALARTHRAAGITPASEEAPDGRAME